MLGAGTNAPSGSENRKAEGREASLGKRSGDLGQRREWARGCMRWGEVPGWVTLATASASFPSGMSGAPALTETRVHSSLFQSHPLVSSDQPGGDELPGAEPIHRSHSSFPNLAPSAAKGSWQRRTGMTCWQYQLRAAVVKLN